MSCLENIYDILIKRQPYVFRQPTIIPWKTRGIYILFLDNEITYVGMSYVCIRSRIIKHNALKFCSAHFNYYTFIPLVDISKDELFELERQYIDYLKPTFNSKKRKPDTQYIVDKKDITKQYNELKLIAEYAGVDNIEDILD